MFYTIITHPITTHAIVAIIGACLGVLVMSMLAIARLGEEELPQPGSQGIVDQDGEAVYPAISWHNASVKVPHADASAATFHRAE